MSKKSCFCTTSFALVLGALSFAVAPAATLAAPRAQLSVGISVTVPPPALPVYTQPPCPGPNYIWTPGYWAWDGEDYYWVPGTWVEAPEPGLFWTPGYWAWQNGAYVFNAGYWGPTVGFYGGIDYGFGYSGHGYDGGRWDHGHFYYNTAVNNVNARVIHDTYVNRTVVVNNNHDRASFNGGKGGIQARPTSAEQSAERNRKMGAIAAQTRQAQDARSDQQLHASYNHGAPPVAATPRPGTFKGTGVEAAHNTATTSAPARPENNVRPANNGRPENLRPETKTTTPNRTPANTPRSNMTHNETRPTTPPANTHASPPNNRQELMRQPTSNHAPANHAAPPAREQTAPRQQPRPAQQHTPPAQVHGQAQAHPAPQTHAQPEPHAQPHAAPHQDRPDQH